MLQADSMPLGDSPDWAFHFETGRLCLDFVATVGDRTHLRFDRWRTPADMARWCVEARLLNEPPPCRSRQLEQARKLRESIYRSVEAVRAGARPKQDDIKELNVRAARPALKPRLDADGHTVRWTFDEPIEAILATVAHDTIALLSGQDTRRIRKCAAISCSVLFVD